MSDFIGALFNAVEPAAIQAMCEEVSKDNASLMARSRSFLGELDSLLAAIDNTETTQSKLKNAHQLLAESVRDLFNSTGNPFVGTLDAQRRSEFKGVEEFTKYREAIGELNYRVNEVLNKHYGKKDSEERKLVNQYIQQATIVSTKYRNEVLQMITGEDYSEQIVFSVEGMVIAVVDINLAAEVIFNADKASTKSSLSKLNNKKLHDVIARVNTNAISDLIKSGELNKYGMKIIDPSELIPETYLKQIQNMMSSLNSVTKKDGAKKFEIGGTEYFVRRGSGGKYILNWSQGNQWKEGTVGNRGDLEEIYLSILLQSEGNKFLEKAKTDFIEGFITATQVDNVAGLFTGDFEADGTEYSAKSHGASLTIIQQAQTLAHQIIGLGSVDQNVSNLIKIELNKSKQASSGSGEVKARNKVIEVVKEELQQLLAF